MANLLWLDHASGITDTKYFNTPFVLGFMIILTDYTINKIINNIDKIDITIVDDVSIAILLKTLNIQPQQIAKYNYVTNCSHVDINISNDVLAYRIKCYSDRNINVKNMKYIVNYLLLNGSNSTGIF